MSEIGPNADPNQEAKKLADALYERAQQVLAPGMIPIPEAERTSIDDVPSVVASGEDWVQYSDGEVLVTIDGIEFYME